MRELNTSANQTVRVEIGNPASTDSRDDGCTVLTIRDEPSGETLCEVEIPAGRWHRLQLGGSQTWPAYVTTDPDRIGKELKVKVLKMPDDTTMDDPAQQAREVYHTVSAEAPDWLDYQSHSVRRTNHGLEAIIRRWVAGDES